MIRKGAELEKDAEINPFYCSNAGFPRNLNQIGSKYNVNAGIHYQDFSEI